MGKHDRLYYDRNGEAIGRDKWIELFEDKKYKVLKQERFGRKKEILVSTVWLGLDHNFAGIGGPIIFETMIFGGKWDADNEYQERYRTEQEAMKGHREAVATVKGYLIKSKVTSGKPTI